MGSNSRALLCRVGVRGQTLRKKAARKEGGEERCCMGGAETVRGQAWWEVKE